MRRGLGPAGIVMIVAAITLVPMLYGNLVTRRGGLLDDSLLNRQDAFYLMDRRAESLMEGQLETSDVVTFVLTFPGGISAEDLQRIRDLTGELKGAFPEYGVLSLSVVPRYRDTGEELLNRPYIDAESLDEIASGRMGFEEWKEGIAADPSVYGLLMGRKFDYATVNVLLPRGFDEIATFRRIADFVEQRRIPWYEWFFKTDIYPAEKYNGVTLAGWATARGLMDAALASDMMRLTTVGLLIVGVVLYFGLRSMRQAMIAMLVVVVCFLWTRGSIGLLQELGFQVYERVYILLVYTGIIVSGISFVERKFECFNEVRAQCSGDTRLESWQKTHKAVDGVILVTAVTALANYATLYQIGIRGILEVGLFSSLGIVYLLILVLWFLPALHSLMGGNAVSGQSPWSRSIADVWERFLQKVVVACHKLLDSDVQGTYAYRGKSVLALAITAGFMAVALLAIASDYVPFLHKDFQFLHVRTKPLDYLPGTIVDKASEILNKEGNYGFDRIPVLVRPGEGIDIYDPPFIKRADELERSIKGMDDVREVSSVVGIMRVIARESYKADLPRTRSEIHDALQMIEWDLGPEIKEQFWFDGGLILFVSFAAVDSNRTGDVVTGILQLARHSFPDLDVVPFGKFVTYPQNDRYIREGKPWNVINSQWIVVVICALWITWRHRSAVASASSSYRLSPWRTGLTVSVPFLFASAVIVLVMMLLRVPLDQATACITALTINAAIDFSLYMVSDYQTALLSGEDPRQALRYALPIKGKIIVIDILLNSLCFAPLMASRFIPVARMGWIMIVMLLACGFGSLVLLPALLPWCTRTESGNNLVHMAEDIQ